MSAFASKSADVSAFMDFAALLKAEKAKARAAAAPTGAKPAAAEAPVSPPVHQSGAAAPLHHYLLPARPDRQHFDPRAHTVRCGIGMCVKRYKTG